VPHDGPAQCGNHSHLCASRTAAAIVQKRQAPREHPERLQPSSGDECGRLRARALAWRDPFARTRATLPAVPSTRPSWTGYTVLPKPPPRPSSVSASSGPDPASSLMAVRPLCCSALRVLSDRFERLCEQLEQTYTATVEAASASMVDWHPGRPPTLGAPHAVILDDALPPRCVGKPWKPTNSFDAFP
jgi:hypothetical protein